MMLGIISAFISAIFASLNDIIKKKVLKELNEITVITVASFFSMLIFFAINLIMGFPYTDNTFWTAIYLSSSLNAFASLLMLRALKIADISSTVPLMALSPVFLLFTSFFMLGEVPSILGTTGVLAVVAGTYAINIHKSKYGLAEPIFELFKNEGSRLALIVGIIYGFTGPFDKIAVQHSNVFMSSFAFFVFTLIVFVPLFIFRVKPEEKKKVIANVRQVGLISIVGALMSYFQNTAYLLTLVPYAIAIKRTSVLFSVTFGGMLFKEKHLKQKVFAALIMVAGLAMIVLGSI
jgi:drug/metabolite transporter (DMT)-like permease